MKPILEIHNLSKKFKIRHESQGYLSLRESLMSLFKPDQASSEDFLALNNISFNVMPGESIGIIGRNGAGKSTLLKVLSKITPPSSGKIISRGRIASLLEVGTGFHPELTGRENIFLNGSILGMKKAEILKNFEEIVSFSGVEKFLDTPLKRYSSGMQLRLAFAVSAFLEPEILIIDEVLAVGDAEFQKKCLGKMDEVSKSGRTVLFVSHNMGMMQQLCPKIALLHKGSLVKFDKSDKVIAHYLNNEFKTKSEEERIFENKKQYIKSFGFKDQAHIPKSVFTHNEQIILNLKIHINQKVNNSKLSIIVSDIQDRRIFLAENAIPDYESGIIDLHVKFPINLLTPGIYKIQTTTLHVPFIEILDIIQDATTLEVIDGGTDLSPYIGNDIGCIFAKCQWEFERK